MSTLVKLQRKGQMVIPRALREQAGIPEGTLLQVSLEGGNILVTPQVTINRTIVNAPGKNSKALLRELARLRGEERPGVAARAGSGSTFFDRLRGR